MKDDLKARREAAKNQREEETKDDPSTPQQSTNEIPAS
jgi:hypothetical protein